MGGAKTKNGKKKKKKTKKKVGKKGKKRRKGLPEHTGEAAQGYLPKAKYEEQLRHDWAFLLEEGHAYTRPVWISEFGTWHDGRDMVKDDQWFGRFLAFTRTHDLDWAYWALDGTESNGTTRAFGSRAEFGLLNTNWDGPVNEGKLNAANATTEGGGGGVLLRKLSSIIPARLGPGIEEARRGLKVKILE